ncbi:MAG: hypothetical protein [Microvirus sp.]|nr:MAG: hypothetical protein [Microvirus sp.]
MKRSSVNKTRSANAFNNGVQRTKYINISPPPSRGGFRL